MDGFLFWAIGIYTSPRMNNHRRSSQSSLHSVHCYHGENLTKASNLSMIPRWESEGIADSSTSGSPLSTGAFFTGGFFTGVFLAVTAGDLLRTEKRNLPTNVRTSVPASSRYSKNTSRRGASSQRWNRIQHQASSKKSGICPTRSLLSGTDGALLWTSLSGTDEGRAFLAS